jgi:hypothetical protein
MFAALIHPFNLALKRSADFQVAQAGELVEAGNDAADAFAGGDLFDKRGAIKRQRLADL